MIPSFIRPYNGFTIASQLFHGDGIAASQAIQSGNCDLERR